MDPPPCVQNAMMTKDKKPFTYTPGGIDLSEVKSPRMQRRIERNANLGGAADMSQLPHPPPQHVGPLPPSALAAMRPQTQVQVFPGPPPPPPMSKNIPPPPPPPICPLPTQKVTTGDNQVIERPDMTKIIPENPMALLRKTGGPAPRKSLIEQTYEEQAGQPPSPPQRNFNGQSPRPPVVEKQGQVSPPVQQQYQPPNYQPSPQQFSPQSPPQNHYQPPAYQQGQSASQSRQASQQQFQPPQTQYQTPQPQFQQQRATDSPKPPGYHPPIIERQSAPRQEPGQKNINAGSLYIPPLAQQQQKVASPPTPPERQPQSPGTPTLKEAPRPWQKSNQQQDIPPWVRKDELEQAESQAQSQAPNRQNRWQPNTNVQQAPPQQPVRQQPSGQQFSPRPEMQQPRSPPTQNQPYGSNSFPVHIEIRTGPYQQEAQPSERNPNAVYVTQPIVLKHPGNTIEPPYKGQPRVQQQPQGYQQQPQGYQQQPQGYQQQPQQYQQVRQVQQQQQHQQQRVETSGTRIIPIQIEGRTTSTATANESRNLNRQLSWGTQPTQSNSFKVIQKFTRTDDDDDETPVTQHSARYPQEMPEQKRRMRINDNGHLKQNNISHEGNGQPQPYVHPSEQVVPEPKKYMGSNIPSRSFKILQAMTAPSDSSANANYNEEIPYTPVYNPYTYPYYPPPYWSDYYTNYYSLEQSEPRNRNGENFVPRDGRPIPSSQSQRINYWPEFVSKEQGDPNLLSNEKPRVSNSKNGRSTPLPAVVPPPMPSPFWGYIPPPPPPYARPPNTTFKTEKLQKELNNAEEPYCYPLYPPYFDPYYYSYYYGYSQMMSPYSYYHAPAENEDNTGYCSADEMSNYNSNRRTTLRRRNSFENNVDNTVQSSKRQFEVRSKSATPRITITPTYSHENSNQEIFPNKTEKSDEYVQEKENETLGANLCRLRSIKSVNNLNVYSTKDDLREDTDTTESDETTTEEETDGDDIFIEENQDESIPHQLSIIYEESERGESRRSFRCNSIASDVTTLVEQQSEHDEDDQDFLAAQSVKYKIKIFQETTDKIEFQSNNKKGHEDRNESFTRINSVSNTCDLQNNSFTKQNASEKCIEKDKGFLRSEPNALTNEENKELAEKEEFEVNTKHEAEQQSDEDWWDVINHENPAKKENTKSVSENVNVNTVLVEVGDEVVTVKLRNKPGRNKNALKEMINESVNSKSEDVFFSSVPQRNSIYDILINEDETEEEVISGGNLMRVDSFASQLEALKRNSGLFNLDEKIGSKCASIIKEESFECNTDEDDKNSNTENVDFSTHKDIEEKSQSPCEEEKPASESSEEIDFWSQIKNDEDDFFPRRRTLYLEEQEEDVNSFEDTNIDSTNSRNSSCSKSQNEGDVEKNDDSNAQKINELGEITENINSNKYFDDNQMTHSLNNSRSRSVEPQTITDRIEALRSSIVQKQQKVIDKEDIVETKILVMEISNESRSKTTSTKSSMKSFEEYSEEEELDSGVISDISRHISDSEEFPELRKLTRYERAATHSRLFKLLQDECDYEEEIEEKEDKFNKLSVRRNRTENKLSPSRSKLSLSLKKCNDNETYKSQVNEKLVEELVQSLLKSKKSQIFKNMPKEKLYAAAITILQEGIYSVETPSDDFSSLLSPLKDDTESSTPAQTPQEFYGESNEYKQYYDTWIDDTIDIMPSKAFKLLQERIGLGSFEGMSVKCPKILSSKNSSKEIVSESGFDCSTPSQNNPKSNDVTNT
ncbi:hypothetical protein ABEB36_008765 [Hypothenemus hampei]|uniref:Uncharacterized protein n=1 Tax=Hypothenemus hampei TaxID=57062 RepID=A0ABD1EN01_HYPHA